MSAARNVAIAITCLVGLATACSSRDDEPADAEASRQVPAQSASQAFVGATQATAGASSRTLLDVPLVGTMAISCPDAGRARIFFTASPKGASAAVVVTTGEGRTVGQLLNPGETLVTSFARAEPTQQTWQIAPVTSAETRVAVIVLGSIPAPASLGGHGCVASARADVTTST